MDWYDSVPDARQHLFVRGVHFVEDVVPDLVKNSIKKRNESSGSSSGLSLKYRMMRDAKARFLPLDYCVVLLIIGFFNDTTNLY
jgi:hypothetical protein